MKLLIDTHVFLWAIYSPKLLSKKVRVLLEDPNVEVFFSSISALEIGLKVAVGKLQADLEKVVQEAESIGFQEAPFLSRHAIGMQKLPQLHSDPFDRAILAQSLCDQSALVSKDREFARYGVELIW